MIKKRADTQVRPYKSLIIGFLLEADRSPLTHPVIRRFLHGDDVVDVGFLEAGGADADESSPTFSPYAWQSLSLPKLNRTRRNCSQLYQVIENSVFLKTQNPEPT
jgi:hypothetical protein